ncbi:MAG: serine hydrolase domain-containing protein [Acidimicrobiales bacterium]
MDLEERMLQHIGPEGVLGAVWCLDRGGDARIRWAGSLDPEGTRPVGRDTLFRISSMTKPITAVTALTLVADGTLVLDDAVDRWLPELAGRRVMRDPDGSLADTVPADRAITPRDLLAFTLGIGMDFPRYGQQPVLQAAEELELGAGPPQPQGPPPPDEWMRRLGTLPLEAQPGERWLYHVGADVLGVLVARAAGRSLEEAMIDRVLGPLGMDGTRFSVPASSRHRFGAVFSVDPASGRRTTYDEVDGQWSSAPRFPSGGAGLVSTIDDYLALARLLRAAGRHDGSQLLPAELVAEMTRNQLTEGQLAASAIDASGDQGFGFCVGVLLRDADGRHAGTYGWSGGMGSDWYTDPTDDQIGIILTNQMFTGPELPPICRDLLTA